MNTLLNRYVSTAEIAELRGIDRTTAWRLLLRLERECGAVLIRKRRGLFITLESFQGAVARDSKKVASDLAAIQRRYEAIEERIANVERRLDVAARATGQARRTL